MLYRGILLSAAIVTTASPARARDRSGAVNNGTSSGTSASTGQPVQATVSTHIDGAREEDQALSDEDIKHSAFIENLLNEILTKAIPQRSPEQFMENAGYAFKQLEKLKSPTLRHEYRARINHLLGIGNMQSPSLIQANRLASLHAEAAIGPILEATALARYTREYRKRFSSYQRVAQNERLREEEAQRAGQPTTQGTDTRYHMTAFEKGYFVPASLVTNTSNSGQINSDPQN